MNFSAFEYWTDGWREGSPMPNDEGLRRCTCGQFVLQKDLVQVAIAESTELQPLDHLPDERLPECFVSPPSGAVEISARLGYWRYLNHAYREAYRRHRSAEEAATRAAWEAANPDRRSWWDRVRGRQTPSYSRPQGSPFTYPAFEPTKVQRENMLRLSELLVAWRSAAKGHYSMELAELNRELGRFDEAQWTIRSMDESNVGVASKLIARLIRDGQTAPMRYMA